jgi:hypothetical protein
MRPVPGRVPLLRTFVVTGALASAVVLSACGATRAPASAAVVHIDGVETGDYVNEMSASGVHFLVPTGLVAGQGSSAFQVADPPLSNAPDGPVDAGFGPRFYGPTASADFSTSAKVEILATGSPGVKFALGWQETCGGTHVGKRAVVGGTGGQGQANLETPAVVLVKLPAPSGDVHTCYLATTGFSRTRTNLHLQIVDY